MRRLAADASTPTCHAVTTVRSSANASTATAIPMSVRTLRSLCRIVLRRMSLMISTGFRVVLLRTKRGRPLRQLALFQMPDQTGLFRSPRIVRDHENGFFQLAVKTLEQA